MNRLTAPLSLRKEVLRRDGHECQYCGHDEKVDVHHIHSVRNDGEHEKDNLVTLCRSCHKIAHSIVPDGEHPVSIMADEGIPTKYVSDERVSRWCEPVLNELKNNRATPTYIHEQTGIDRDRINSCLSNMLTAGWVTKLCRGFYEITDDGRSEIDANSPGDDAPDIDAAQFALEAAIRAAEQGDDQELQRRLREIQEALSDD